MGAEGELIFRIALRMILACGDSVARSISGHFGVKGKFGRTMRIGSRSSTFRFAKIGRALQRQATPFVLTAFGVASVGFLSSPTSFHSNQGLALWFGGAIVAGLVVAAARELMRDTAAAFKTIERKTSYSIVGAAPELTPREMRDLPPDQRTPIGYLIHKPASPFAQATRELQSAIAGQKVVAFIGAVPNEGATTAALCAAASATQQGYRAIVLDCDVRRRSLSRVLQSNRKIGILQAAHQPEIWQAAVDEEPETGMHFMPAAQLQSVWHNLFDAPGFGQLIEMLREHYDLIVLDCPPALIAADGAMIARVADKCIIVMGWDATPLRVIRDTRRAFRRRGGPKSPSLYVNRAPAEGPKRGRRGSSRGSSRGSGRGRVRRSALAID